VETSLAKWGDAEEFAIIEQELRTNTFQTAILKMQVIGGPKAVSALLAANVKPDYAVFDEALFKSLARMIQDPPLPPDADPTVENLRKWQVWWAKNEASAKFAYPAPYE
jgi:hypothetical protein